MAQFFFRNKRCVRPSVGLISCRGKSCLALSPPYPSARRRGNLLLPGAAEEAGAELLPPWRWNHSEVGILRSHACLEENALVRSGAGLKVSTQPTPPSATSARHLQLVLPVPPCPSQPCRGLREASKPPTARGCFTPQAASELWMYVSCPWSNQVLLLGCPTQGMVICLCSSHLPSRLVGSTSCRCPSLIVLLLPEVRHRACDTQLSDFYSLHLREVSYNILNWPVGR